MADKKKKALIIIIVAAIILYIPFGILLSLGLSAEKIEIGEGGTEIKIAHLSDIQYPAAGIKLEKILNVSTNFNRI